MLHGIRCDDVQAAVASQARGKRGSAAHQIEVAQHLDHLSPGLRPAQEVASHEVAVLEHSDVASEQYGKTRSL